MKLIKYSAILGLFSLSVLTGCKNFEEINTDPNAVSENDVRIEFLLNKSIYEAQQNPEIAERAFILYWDRVCRFEAPGGISTMTLNDGWSSTYWKDYSLQWIKYADLAVTIGDKRIADGTASNAAIEKATVQIARIWRAYLYSELADNFGPIPRSNAFQGPNVELTFDSVEDVYNFILNELKEASANLDENLKKISDLNDYDMIFQGDVVKWKKYANSMRLRYAMRISKSAPGLAQQHFEEAAKLPLITSLSDIAQVQERGGWDATTGVMTRSWNWQQVSLTMNNLTFGLGGINVSNMTGVSGLSVSGLPSDIITKHAKNPSQYLGLRMPNHLSSKTNVDNSGYLFNAIPEVADPRLFKNFSLPGYNDGVVSKFAGKRTDKPEPSSPVADSARISYPKVEDGKLSAEENKLIRLGSAYTWIGRVTGSQTDLASLFSGFTGANQNIPCKSAEWCDNDQKRVFFGPWETYFLLAEAALYGWNTNGISDAQAYEDGIKSSFNYLEISSLASQYITSQSYNLIGTSVDYNHTSEASDLSGLSYIEVKESNLELDPTTNNDNVKAKVYVLKNGATVETTGYKYPKGFYATNNDKLTKIITQKYLAQCPWLPLEAWSDYRRLGLPFMENPVREAGLVDMPWYTDYAKADIRNIPGRLAYPQNLVITNKVGYDSGVSLLKGEDNASTSLWWAKKN